MDVDPRFWAANEGRDYAQAGRWEQAVAAFTAALKGDDDDAGLRAMRGQALVELGRWPDAAADLGRAITRGIDDPEVHYLRAVSRLLAGDPTGYCAACSAMLRNFGDREDTYTSNRVAYACICAPDAVGDLPALVRAAERAARIGPGEERIAGAALYRAGRFEEALARFDQSHQAITPRAWDRLFQAMAHARLGHADEARRLLDRANRRMAEADRQPSFGGDGRQWYNRLIAPLTVRLRRRETESVMLDQSFPGDPFAR